MSYSLCHFLACKVSGDADALEYGAGGSTLWLATHVGRLTSVEHDASWYARVLAELHESNLGNCTVHLRKPEAVKNAADTCGVYGSTLVEGDFASYVKVIDGFPNESLDLVVVDGRARPACMLHATEKVKPGGYLVLDDSDRARYQDAENKLNSWPRRDFRGIKPFAVKPSVSSVWLKP